MKDVRQAIEMINTLDIEGKEAVISILRNSLSIPIGSKVSVTLGETTCVVLLCNLGKVSSDTYKIQLIDMEDGYTYSPPRNLELHKVDGVPSLTYKQFQELLSYDQEFHVITEKDTLLSAFRHAKDLYDATCLDHTFCTGCPLTGVKDCSELDDYLNGIIELLEGEE